MSLFTMSSCNGIPTPERLIQDGTVRDISTPTIQSEGLRESVRTTSAGQVMFSNWVISSSDNFQSFAAMLADSCSTFIAPAITEANHGWESSQAIASSPTLWPRSLAKVSSLDNLSKFVSANTTL